MKLGWVRLAVAHDVGSYVSARVLFLPLGPVAFLNVE